MTNRGMIVGVVGICALVACCVLPGISVAAADAQVRVIHTSPDTPPVDVYVDGAKSIAALGFNAASPYLPLPAGNHDFQLYPSGVTPATSPPVIHMAGVEIPKGAKRSIVAIGRFASIKVLNIDDATPAPTNGMAKVRVVDAAQDVSTVDLATLDGAIHVANVQFGNVYPYQDVGPGDYVLMVHPAGRTESAFSVRFSAMPNTTYSIYLLSLGMARPLIDTMGTDASDISTTVTVVPPPMSQSGSPVAVTMVGAQPIPAMPPAPQVSATAVPTRQPASLPPQGRPPLMMPATGVPTVDTGTARDWMRWISVAVILIVLGSIVRYCGVAAMRRKQ